MGEKKNSQGNWNEASAYGTKSHGHARPGKEPRWNARYGWYTRVGLLWLGASGNECFPTLPLSSLGIIYPRMFCIYKMYKRLQFTRLRGLLGCTHDRWLRKCVNRTQGTLQWDSTCHSKDEVSLYTWVHKNGPLLIECMLLLKDLRRNIKSGTLNKKRSKWQCVTVDSFWAWKKQKLCCGRRKILEHGKAT